MKKFISNEPEFENGFDCINCIDGKCIYDHSEAYVSAHANINKGGIEWEVYNCNSCYADISYLRLHTADYGLKRGWGVY